MTTHTVTTNTQAHRPAGTSAGGQFAPTAHAEADVQLCGYCFHDAYPPADIAQENAARERADANRRSQRDREQIRVMQARASATIARLNRREQERTARVSV